MSQCAYWPLGKLLVRQVETLATHLTSTACFGHLIIQLYINVTLCFVRVENTGIVKHTFLLDNYSFKFYVQSKYFIKCHSFISSTVF